jgi:hypothetical protein
VKPDFLDAQAFVVRRIGARFKRSLQLRPKFFACASVNDDGGIPQRGLQLVENQPGRKIGE